ncbi:MAG: hypothetical protein WCT24_00745 [Patescibacteria group bacterium]|jgi:hypothetical protein
MQLARPVNRKKERMAMILIVAIGLLVFLIWLFQLGVLFSKGAETIPQEIGVSRANLQAGIDYAKSLQEALPIADGSLSDIIDQGKTITDSVAEQSLMESIANALKGKYEEQHADVKIQAGLPKAGDATWTIDPTLNAQ